MMLDLKAQTGIMVLILLAGLVLAGLFITGKLGKKDADVEQEVTQGAPLAPKIIEVVGYAGNGGVAVENITKLLITISLAPGSSSIPYEEIAISYRSKELFIPQILYTKDLGASEFSTSTDNDIPDYGVLSIKEDIKNHVLDKGEIIELHFWIEDNKGDHPLAHGDTFLVTVARKGTRPSEFQGTVPKKVNTLYILKWA
jgi:archaellin